jgi:hypothetical protein
VHSLYCNSMLKPLGTLDYPFEGGGEEDTSFLAMTHHVQNCDRRQVLPLPMSQGKTIPATQVAQHNTKESCWIIVHGALKFITHIIAVGLTRPHRQSLRCDGVLGR